MPFIYNWNNNINAASDLTTSATPNTELENVYVATPSLGVRVYCLQSVFCSGKNAGLTVISGIAYRIKKWTTTASTGGNAVAPIPRDPGDLAAASTGLSVGSSNFGVITSGTGGPTYVGGFTSGATGPGGWIGPNANSYMLDELSAGTASSIDVFSSSGTASLKYECSLEIQG